MAHALRPKTRGGRRAGAGRPPRGPISSEPHKTRPEHDERYPVHVIARVADSYGSFATPLARESIRRAITKSLGQIEFRIVYLAVLAPRLELIVEARDKIALTRGVKGFQIAVARNVNYSVRPRRKGQVFADRYRAEPLRTLHAVERVIRAWPEVARTASPQTWLLQSSELRRTRPPA